MKELVNPGLQRGEGGGHQSSTKDKRKTVVREVPGSHKQRTKKNTRAHTDNTRRQTHADRHTQTDTQTNTQTDTQTSKHAQIGVPFHSLRLISKNGHIHVQQELRTNTVSVSGAKQSHRKTRRRGGERTSVRRRGMNLWLCREGCVSLKKKKKNKKSAVSILTSLPSRPEK